MRPRRDVSAPGDALRVARATPRRRIAVTSVVVVSAVALLAAGWFAAGAFRSPQQVAAAASPPPPSEVTAEVTRGELRDEITVQSAVRRQRTGDVPLPATAEGGVVTAHPSAAGAAVGAGAVVVEVNGAPVFLLPGAFPFYRDIALGDSGPDVRQLQQGLRRAGFDIAADGTLGPATRGAVENLYRNAGHTAPSAGVTSEVSAPGADPRTDAGETAEPVADDPALQPESHEAIVVVEAASFVVVRDVPAFLSAVPAVGSSGDAATTLTLASGPLVASATVTSATAVTLSLDMTGSAVLPDGTDLPMAVTSIGDTDEDGNVAVTLTPTDGALPDDLTGGELVVSLTRQLIAEEALLVPARALASRGPDDQVILRRDSDGAFSEVRVREIAALGGRSAIEVIDGGDLAAGDEVMVP